MYIMVWWLLKKRDGRDDIHKKIDNIHNSVQGSFKNIKEDMTKLNEWISQVHNHHTNNSKNINKKLLEIEMRLTKIENVILEEVEKEESEEEELSIPTIKSNVLEELTATQKKVFLAIYQAQIQLNQAVSIKSLANLLYKDKSYNQVRSMLSDYLSILTELNLIDKKRVGRNTYVSLTSKGIEIIKKSNILKQKNKIR